MSSVVSQFQLLRAIGVFAGAVVSGFTGLMVLRLALHFLKDVGGPGTTQQSVSGGLVGGVTAMPGVVPTIWNDLRGLAKERQ